jgi:hypothetical protein
MQLLPYPENHPIQVKLDWVEFSCLSNPYFTFRISELRNILENLESFSTSDIAQEDAEVENEIQRILDQNNQRQLILGSSYPFKFNEESQCIELSQPQLQDLAIDQHTYLYCLYFSHIAKSRLFSGLPDTTGAQRDLLQIAATIALAGFVQGHSVSFGWPRPDGSKFHECLSRTIARIGEGTIKPFGEVNAYLQSRPHKDAGVDVISWKEANPFDRMPGGKIIYFAQVASGNNWRSKSVKSDIESIQTHWLNERIFRITDAIVIPFDFESDDEDIKRGEVSVVANEFGAVLHRLRLPSYLRAGVELMQSRPDLLIERCDEIQTISEYVINITGNLQEEAA